MKNTWVISHPFIINPESVYYSSQKRSLFVSNVVGNELEKDGQGWISKLSPTGKILQAQWATGLNAPHGMRAYKGMLWVADIDELVAIDLKSAQIVSRIPIPGAAFLNDVAISQDGKIFVSDTLKNRIYQVDRGKATVFVTGRKTESPNGLLVEGKQLFVAGWGLISDSSTFETKTPGNIFSLDLKSRKKQKVTKVPLGNLDGIEKNRLGNFIVSDYSQGKLFIVDAENGQPRQLLSGLNASADIAFIPPQETVVIPSLEQSTVTAYSYQQHPLFHQQHIPPRSRKTNNREDRLIERKTNDPLLGKSGSDILHGQQGQDWLQGRDGNDILYGGRGEDWLSGGAGQDSMTGGAGTDIFVVQWNRGRDEVLDFQDGLDRLYLSDELRFEQLEIKQQNQDVLIKAGNQQLMQLNNMKADLLTVADIQF